MTPALPICPSPVPQGILQVTVPFLLCDCEAHGGRRLYEALLLFSEMDDVRALGAASLVCARSWTCTHKAGEEDFTTTRSPPRAARRWHCGAHARSHFPEASSPPPTESSSPPPSLVAMRRNGGARPSLLFLCN